MSVAIIVGTHGEAAEQLIKTVEMLIGKQDNIDCINFFPGENADTLVLKYQRCLDQLNINQGVIFLVDTWGGSPFNAAIRIVENKKNYEVITGVNIPMLIEVLMARDDDINFEQLVSTALTSGKEGIRTLHEQKLQIDKTTTQRNNDPSPPQSISQGNYMTICLARIDDRLIHGQVATRWTKESNVSRIIVVSDEVAEDKVRSTLLKQVAPPGVQVHVTSIEKMSRVYNNPKYSQDRVMLLFTNPTDVLRLVQSGVNITSVNVGGMAYSVGKVQVTNAISLDQNDVMAFNKLNELGIKLEARQVSSDTPIDMMTLLKKYSK